MTRWGYDWNTISLQQITRTMLDYPYNITENVGVMWEGRNYFDYKHYCNPFHTVPYSFPVFGQFNIILWFIYKKTYPLNIIYLLDF